MKLDLTRLRFVRARATTPSSSSLTSFFLLQLRLFSQILISSSSVSHSRTLSRILSRHTFSNQCTQTRDTQSRIKQTQHKEYMRHETPGPHSLTHHNIRREQITPTNRNHHQANRKQQRPNHPNQTRCIVCVWDICISQVPSHCFTSSQPFPSSCFQKAKPKKNE